ncbi:hypothetical protein TNCV_5052351 [Trichonephila clavipes]|nr:hypothetical protein TNCV_5052351 [Trichonephila clavipes]
MSVLELGELPYKIVLAVGYPYMITTNNDVEDGMVNGAIDVLKNIELLSEDEQYAEFEQNQLVYVTLSRVTSLDSHYDQSSKRFQVLSRIGQASPTVREVRDEYQRLSQHPLPKLVAKVKKLCDSVPDQRGLILITAINAQSLVAHSEDISTEIPSSTDLIWQSAILG